MDELIFDKIAGMMKDQAMLDDEPLRPPAAKKLMREIMEEGEVTFTDPHAYDELAKDGLETTDALNVLRAGIVDEAQFENGAWRYRVHTPRICVVVEFQTRKKFVVITAWRIRR